MKTWLSFLVSAALAVSIGAQFTACGQTDSHRQSEKKQNEANVQDSRNEIMPSLGRFEGSMFMTETGKKYDAVLYCTLIYKVIASPQDPAQTISIPKISGSLHFPFLEHIKDDSYIKYEELLLPMGGYLLLSFDNGDFDMDNHELDLPYPIPQFPERTWGELQGQLVNDVLTGSWITKMHGVVGRFRLIRVADSDPPK
jgi:hypothetical protein